MCWKFSAQSPKDCSQFSTIYFSVLFLTCTACKKKQQNQKQITSYGMRELNLTVRPHVSFSKDSLKPISLINEKNISLTNELFHLFTNKH